MKKFLANKSSRRIVLGASALAVLLAASGVAYATHSWGPYHWARMLNPFTVKLGDNVSAAWDSHLAAASADWSASLILDTAVVAGQSNKNCSPTKGRVEVCSNKYGNTGWLGIAQIWIDSNNHITQGVTKMNDTYFLTPTYNTPAWRQFVMCQEIGHTFGLAHQDENFSNTNLGSCMDYTNDPDGTLSGQPDNRHPNAHDYDQLALIYGHLDTYTTLIDPDTSGPGKPNKPGRGGPTPDVDVSDPSEWGAVLRRDGRGRPSLYGRDLGKGEKVFTFVLWANEK